MVRVMDTLPTMVVFGVLLGCSELMWARAHSIVAEAPGHPAQLIVRQMVKVREFAAMPIGIFALALGHLYPSAQVVLVISSVSALALATVLLVGANGIRARIAVTALKAQAHSRLSGVVNAAVEGSDEITEDNSGSLSNGRAVSPTTASGRNAIEALRAQRQLTQALWDTPTSMVLVNRDGRIVSRAGGATRSTGFPEELTGQWLDAASELGRTVAAVLSSGHRAVVDVRRNGRALTGVVSPWFTGAGSIRGVVVSLMSIDEVSYTDEMPASTMRAV